MSRLRSVELRRGKQVSGKKNEKTETSVFVIWNFYFSHASLLQCAKQPAPVPAKPLNSDPRTAGYWTSPEDQVFDVEKNELVKLILLTEKHEVE